MLLVLAAYAHCWCAYAASMAQEHKQGRSLTRPTFRVVLHPYSQRTRNNDARTLRERTEQLVVLSVLAAYVHRWCAYPASLKINEVVRQQFPYDCFVKPQFTYACRRNRSAANEGPSFLTSASFCRHNQRWAPHFTSASTVAGSRRTNVRPLHP